MLYAGKEGSPLRGIALGKEIPDGIGSGTIQIPRAPHANIYEIGPVKFGASELEVAAAKYSLHAEMRAKATATRREPGITVVDEHMTRTERLVVEANAARFGRFTDESIASEVSAAANARPDTHRDHPALLDVGGEAVDAKADRRHAQRPRVIFERNALQQ